ncbi:hypothetical protein EX895_000354 [Sporisorium graminicola]|uniref:Integral membrane protein n=1 Tax=Sporisorium graminicola TaxID=280036 RepID=A0A4U7L0W5_9BASI|nr:hypothetical protein EX895_000354 [Sporisorium graminicola]TKY90356.1 hypothetical protein EX895_000354 [Sporisorium graminicola]
MRPIHRIPSSIRVRRADTDASRNGFYSSAEQYSDADAQLAANHDATPTQPPHSFTDYFTPRRSRRGSIPTYDGPGHTTRGDGGTPSAEGPLGHSPRTNNNDQDNDDDILRSEMQTARRAIHDQERDEQRHHHGSRSSRTPPADFPAIRLSDDSFRAQGGSGASSRRPGAVEALAMRHHRQRKEERRKKRQAQRNSVSTASSHSSATESRNDSATADNDASLAGSDGAGSRAPHLRNLSDVQEEQRSRMATPQSTQPGPILEQSPPADAVQGEMPNLNRARRNTVAEDGLMASSRRLYDTLMRRRTDRDLSANDAEDRTALAHHPRANDDDADDNLSTPASSGSSSGMHEDEVVDYLDVVDPEVATVTALQNVGNSIFFPPIPMLYNRRPTISLPTAAPRNARASTPRATPNYEARNEDIELGLRPSSAMHTAEEPNKDADKFHGFGSMRRVASLVPGRRQKQVPPTTEEERRKHIKEWAEMDEEERNELDEHVHLLLTKKAKFKRAARGFWRYVKTPQGFIITTYAVLITFWGTAICLFLLRWIDVGNKARQRYWIEICDQILCALFTAVGLGFAPFRAVDTYRMVQIVHYHRLTYKRRKKLDLPELKDKNELPRAAPRLTMAQMANTMMVKTSLRKNPAPATQEEGQDGVDAQGAVAPEHNHHASLEGATNSGDSSWELLDAVQSRHSACEVEELKEKRRKKHAFLHRKKKHDVEEGCTEQCKKAEGGADDDAIPSPPPAAKGKPVPKTYANKDGVIPLGQLKRNPSIASELPRDAEDVVVLSPKQQANLEYQQRKFHESHTFYRYRETVTHRPFELSLMMAVVILLDCHSCLQASLGGTTWGIYYKNRPTSVTATIITFSLSCNAVAGLLIWYGGNRTKKKEEVERLLGIALEEEALRKIRKKERRRLEAEREAQSEWVAGEYRLHGKSQGTKEEVAKEGKEKVGQSATGVTGATAGAPLECIDEH